MIKNKFISKAVSAVASVAMVFTSIPSIYVMDNAVAADTMTAWEITENMKIGWNLGNTLDAKASNKAGDLETAGLETETSWGCPRATQELFDALKAKGFNTVRVPTTWFQHLDADNNIDPEWMARVKEVVDYGIKNDMYIILNVHHENWINRGDFVDSYDEIQPKLLKIWTQIATEFKDYDQHLIFECMNEPRAVGQPHEWWAASAVPECDVINQLEHDFVDLIRGMDGPYAKTRLLMLPGYCASAETQFLEAIDVPDDDFVAISVHAYSPYDFTMNSAIEDHSVFAGTKYSQQLTDILTGIRQTFIEKDIPVVIGEMGTSNFDNTEARVEWTTQYFTTTKKYGIPCCLWDNNTVSNPKDPGECHGYINRTTYEWYEESSAVIDKMMEIMADDSVVWGSEKKAPKLNHADLSDGTVFLEGPVEIDAAKSETYENTTPGKDITWAELEGKEVAVKFTGKTPLLSLSNEGYGNWTELKPYSIDDEAGIAYYLMSQLPEAWGKDMATLAHMQTRTDGVTTIESITILPEPEGEIDIPAPTSKIYKISFEGADREGTLVIKFKGEPGTATNGCVGFMLEEWTQVNWSGKLDADGNLTVEIAMSEIPASVENAEIQIWNNFEALEMVSNEIVSGTPAATTTTQPPVASTTTTSANIGDGKVGDANLDNKVSVADAVAILQHIANRDKYQLKPQGLLNADVDGVAGVTGNDALVIQKVDAGVISVDELPLNAA